MYKISGSNTLLDVGLILTKAELGQGMTVADLGCGTTGHFVFPASDIVGRRGTVYAVDIMKVALEAIKKRVLEENRMNIITVWSDLEIFGATKIESSSLDRALLINTLYQSHKRAEILRETVRMMKSKAKLVVVEWKSISIPFGPPPEERVNMNQLVIGARKLGLEMEEEFFVGQFHYGLLFVKI
jgi:ubiquinone/menaquinone biosynthesis C-methylase UbiE